MKKFPNPVDTFMSGCPKIFFQNIHHFRTKGKQKVAWRSTFCMQFLHITVTSILLNFDLPLTSSSKCAYPNRTLNFYFTYPNLSLPLLHISTYL